MSDLWWQLWASMDAWAVAHRLALGLVAAYGLLSALAGLAWAICMPKCYREARVVRAGDLLPWPDGHRLASGAPVDGPRLDLERQHSLSDREQQIAWNARQTAVARQTAAMRHIRIAHQSPWTSEE